MGMSTSTLSQLTKEEERNLGEAAEANEAYDRNLMQAQEREQNDIQMIINGFRGSNEKQKEIDRLLAAYLKAMENKNFADALSVTTRMINLAPKEGIFYRSRGRVYWIIREPGKGEKEFRKALSLLGADPIVFAGIGDCLAAQDKDDSAYVYFMKAVALDTMDHRSYFEIGRIQVTQDKPEDAIKNLTRAITLDPNDPLYYEWRADAYNRLQPPANEKILSDIAKIETLNPQAMTPYAFTVRGEGLARLKKDELAIKEFEKALKLDSGYRRPKTEMSFSMLNLTEKMPLETRKVNMLRTVLQYANELIAADSSYRMGYAAKTEAMIQQGKYSEAVQFADIALIKFPKYAQLYNRRGYAYFKMKKYNAAREDYLKAISLGSKDFKPAHDYLSKIPG